MDSDRCSCGNDSDGCDNGSSITGTTIATGASLVVVLELVEGHEVVRQIP